MVAFVAVLGLLVGSFLNVVILRVPERRSIAFPGSACTSCGTPIRWYDNLPVLSWLLLRGRCRSCKAGISVRYAVVEAVTGALFVAVVWRFGIAWHTPVYLAFAATMVALTFIDVDHRIIPNVISLPGMLVGVVLSFLIPRPEGAFLPVSWQSSLLGVLLGGGFLWATAEIYFRLRGREGMGMGDVKMLGMIGAFLGAMALPFVVVVSALTGTAVGIAVMVASRAGLKTAIPFGPFLALGALLYLFIGPEVMDAYLRASLPSPAG